MTDTRTPPPDDDADLLAAEYVLGVLDLSDRIAVEERMKRDSTLSAQVLGWEQRFSALNDDFAESPAPDILTRIEGRLFVTPAPAPKRGYLMGWLLGAGAAAALALAAVFVLPSLTPNPPLVATLSAEAQPLVFAASYSGDTLTLTQSGGPAAEDGRDYELWLIVGTAAPVSLGLIDAASVTKTLADLPDGAVLAVSLEPDGGSTTGAPTGPVLVTGAVSRG